MKEFNLEREAECDQTKLYEKQVKFSVQAKNLAAGLAWEFYYLCNDAIATKSWKCHGGHFVNCTVWAVSEFAVDLTFVGSFCVKWNIPKHFGDKKNR